MEHYVTLFDSLFLPQGLALHASLERHAVKYTLWVLCMDVEAKQVLDGLDKPNLKTVALADVETPELLAIKPGRTKGEYCWTLTPFAPKMVFDRDASVRRVTYLDADLFFFKNPEPIFREFAASGKSVLITSHGYAPEYDRSAVSGIYCVQFVSFIRDKSEPVRQWWEDRCVEWCFSRAEDGKFGDQKYLDDWPERFFDHVHVLQAQQYTLAPWNANRFPYNEAIFYHFHELRLLPNNKVLLYSQYSMHKTVVENVYGPYLRDFSACVAELQTAGLECRPQHPRFSWIYVAVRFFRQINRKWFYFKNFRVANL